MTSRKPPAEDSDIIEGVAVERQEDGKASGEKSSGKGAANNRGRRRTARNAASDSKTNTSQQAKTDTPAGDNGPANTTSSNGVSRMPVMLAGFAVAVSLAGLGLQLWRAGPVDSALRTSIDTLAAQLAAAEADAKAAREETAKLQDMLAGMAASLPPGLSNEIAGLAARQDVLEAGLAAVEPTGSGPAGPGGDAALALAQSGMGVAVAMINDSLSGGDPSRWLATLSELRAAGLAVGDLDALRHAMIPMPPTHGALMVEARDLIEPLRRDAAKDGHGGWWSAATGKLSDFVTLRRQGDDASGYGTTTVGAPLLAFERAVMADRLADALAASGDLESGVQALEDWRAAAGRRLSLDDGLAAFSADMAARLARSRAGRAE